MRKKISKIRAEKGRTLKTEKPRNSLP